MKYIRLLFYILFISKTIVIWGGENIGGLSFRAYEYSKDERTSFIIPSGNQGVRFKDYLSVSFDLKIREKGEHFGYVCRMIVDNRNSLNLILVNPVNEEPYLCLIKDQQYLGKIHSSAPIDIHEWYVDIIGYQLFVVNTVEKWMCFLLAYGRKPRFNVFNLILQEKCEFEVAK